MKSLSEKAVVFIFQFSVLLSLTGISCKAQPGTKKPEAVQFRKHVLTTDFIAEGVAVADVNKDGKPDVLAGSFWFEAPTWIKHELAEPKKYSPDTEYSNAFLSYSLDVNRDGWVDFIRIGYPGKEAVWYENPKNKTGHWKAHLVYKSVGNESPAFADVDGDNIADLICADSEDKKVIWLKAPVLHGDSSWKSTVISSDKNRGTHMYTHGLGLGDVNGDGRKDVLIKDGWWEAPIQLTTPEWTFHPAKIGEECAQMYVLDVNGDGRNDVISSSAHAYGIWWHEQQKDTNASVTWVKHEISKLFSQSHSLALCDINGDGHPDLITGKRYYAHNGKDTGAHEPSVLYWYEFKPGKQPTWTPREIDNNSGVGLNIVTLDMNSDGRIDIVVANKKGVHIFEQN